MYIFLARYPYSLQRFYNVFKKCCRHNIILRSVKKLQTFVSKQWKSFGCYSKIARATGVSILLWFFKAVLTKNLLRDLTKTKNDAVSRAAILVTPL